MRTLESRDPKLRAERVVNARSNVRANYRVVQPASSLPSYANIRSEH